MSIAERTREAVREHPFLYEALRAGVVNYTEAARFLDVGDDDAVTAALRRYAEELSDADATTEGGSVRVRIERGVGRADDGGGLLVVNDERFAPGAGNLTAILATGGVTLDDTQRVLGRCSIADLDVTAAGFTGETLVLVVGGRDGPDVIRLVESATE